MATKKLLRAMSLLVVLVSGTASFAEAANFTISRHDYTSGMSRVASASGYVYALMPGEVVTDVRVYTNNTQGPTGSAEGTYAPSTGYWTIGDGAFDLHSYYVVVTTNYYGHKLTASSPVYTWGH